MQFLVSVIAHGSESANPGEMAAIDAFNDRLRANGHWVYANGLADPATAIVVDARGDVPVITDGPFHTATDYVAGFWIIEAPNLDVARQLAADGSKVCNRRVELRPFHALAE